MGDAPKAGSSVTKLAHYECKWGPVRGEYDTLHRALEVSVISQAKESEADIEKRLKEMAEEMKSLINGCHNKTFLGFEPLNEEVMTKSISAKQESVAPEKYPIQEAMERCKKNGLRCYF